MGRRRMIGSGSGSWVVGRGSCSGSRSGYGAGNWAG